MAAVFVLSLFSSAFLLFTLQPIVGRMLLPQFGGSPAVWNVCLVFFQFVLLLGYLYSHWSATRLRPGMAWLIHLLLLAVTLFLLPMAPPVRTGTTVSVREVGWVLLIGYGVPVFTVSTTSPLVQRWYGFTRSVGSADPYFLSIASNLGSLVALIAYPLVIEPRWTIAEQNDWWSRGYPIFAVLTAICGLAAIACSRGATIATNGASAAELNPSHPDSAAVISRANTNPSEPQEPVSADSASAPPPPIDDDGGVPLDSTSAGADISPVTAPPDPKATDTETTLQTARLSTNVSNEPTNVPAGPLTWMVLAFVPASLLSSISYTLTTDLAPVPLLWIIPLAAYLLTYIIAFMPRVRLPFRFLSKLASIVSIAWTLTYVTYATEPVNIVIAVQVVTFFVIALLCHGRAAELRPPARRLTAYYLWLSLGGVVGGGFNAIVAPTIFSRWGLLELPLMIVVALLLRPSVKSARFGVRDLIGFALPSGLIVTAGLLTRDFAVSAQLHRWSDALSVPFDMLRSGLIYGLPLIIAYLWVDRRYGFPAAVAAVLCGSAWIGSPHGRTLERERNFLGVVSVAESADGQFRVMVHGNTVHGQQRIRPHTKTLAAYLQPLAAINALQAANNLAAGDGRWDDLHRPLTYYHPSGPAGQIFRGWVDGLRGPRRIGAVGLGTGALAGFARPNQTWRFFELDPAVDRMARDPRLFTYLRDSHAESLDVVMGDARLTLANEQDGSFDLLVLDAFSSDAIPTHLLTREAFALYRRKLKSDGLLLMHVSNRYLDLPPVIARTVSTGSSPMITRLNDDTSVSDVDKQDGKTPSQWVLIGPPDGEIRRFERNIRWQLVRPTADTAEWTDDRVSIFRAFRKSED